MEIPLTSMEQLMPFPTAEELVAKKHEPAPTVSPGMSVLAALQVMMEKRVGFLVVVEDSAPIGVLSDGDCARRVILGKLDAGSTTVREIMSKTMHSVQFGTKIQEAIILMHEKDIRHLPVMRGSELIGVLTVRDMMGALIERYQKILRRLGEERLTLLNPNPSTY